MAQKQINYEIKTYFDKLKKQQKVTSKDIAAAIGVSRQTMSAMSGCLDQVSVLQAVQIASAMKTDPNDFIFQILSRSETLNTYNKI